MTKKFNMFYVEVTFNDGTMYTKIVEFVHRVAGGTKEYERRVHLLTMDAFNRFDGWFTIRVHGMISGTAHDWHLERIPEEIMELYPHDISDILPF